MKKCFDNIKSLDMARLLYHHEATHMNSSEGEKVQFKSPVRLEGVVEVSEHPLLRELPNTTSKLP